MAQGPYGTSPGSGGFTLQPQGMNVANFFQQWGPVAPFGPQRGIGPGPVAPGLPMYSDTWDGNSNPLDEILPPADCPQPCPTTVRSDLCAPRKRPLGPWDDPDEFGDPAYSPPGVRTVPEWETTGVKSVPGGPALVGPAGAFVFPTPKLPEEPRGAAVPAGEVVGSPGAVTPQAVVDPSGIIPAARKPFRIPWWGWIAAGVVVWQIVGKR
jgi:hypothetical protein